MNALATPLATPFTPALFVAHLTRIQNGSRFRPNLSDRLPPASDAFWQTPQILTEPIAQRLSVPPGPWPPVALMAFVLMGSGRTSNDAWLERQRLEELFREAAVPDGATPLGPSCHALADFLNPTAEKASDSTLEATWIQVAQWLKSLTSTCPGHHGTSWTLMRGRLETRLADHLEEWWWLVQEHRLHHGDAPFHPPCAFPASAHALLHFTQLWSNPAAELPLQHQSVLACMADLMTWLRPQDDDLSPLHLNQVGQVIGRLIGAGALWPKTQTLVHPVFDATPGLAAGVQASLIAHAVPSPAAQRPRGRL